MSAPAADRPPLAPRLARALRPVDVAVDAAQDGELDWEAALVTGSFPADRPDADILDVAASTVVGVRLAGAAFRRVSITDTVFDRCDLSGVLLGTASLSRVELRDCRLSGLNLGGAQLTDVRLVGCRMDGASLRMASGQHLCFEDCGMAGSDFTGATFARARLFDCDLTGAVFSQARLDGARLHGSTLEAIIGGGALRGVVIGSGQLLSMAMLALAAMGVRIDDDRGPPA
ncbi:MAG: pentapeptide repeat-containing protein [Acidimicrobiales bacterium]